MERRLVQLAARRGQMRPPLSPQEADDLRARVWRALLTGKE